MNTPSVSIIIPTHNEQEHLPVLLRAVRSDYPQVQLIVADGGSRDATPEIARQLGAQVCTGPAGRGIQCNAGARLATGSIVIFLHADTLLPDDAIGMIASVFSDPEVSVARFRIQFDQPHPLLKFYSFWTRFDSLWTAFGDQGIVVRKSFFDALGGFADWPLLEDVDFFRRARKHTRVRLLPGSVTTSARRFKKNGVLRQQLYNGYIIAQYLCGVSPQKLARKYKK